MTEASLETLRRVFSRSLDILLEDNPKIVKTLFEDVHTEEEWKVLLAHPDEQTRKMAQVVLREYEDGETS